MTTIVYLSNQMVQAVEMKSNGSVSVYEELAPEGSIINGIVTDEEVFGDFLKHFFAAGKLSKKDCTLVLNSTQITTRILELPRTGYNDLNNMMLHEFGDSRTENMLMVFLPMSMDHTSRMMKLLASAADKNYIESYVKLFAQAGIEVKCIEPAMINFTRRFMEETSVTKKNCVVQIYDGSEVISILFVEGSYLYSQRNRIFADSDAEGFTKEIRAVAQRLRQFATSQKIEKPVERLLICGTDQKKIVETMLEKDDLDSDAEILEYKDSNLKIHKKKSGSGPVDFVYALERQKPDKKLNYIWKMHHDSPENRKKREAFHLALPAILALVICLVITAFLANSYWMNLHSAQNLQESIRENDTESAAYDLSEANVNRLKNQVANAQLLWDQLMSYPTITSGLNTKLQECAGTDVQAEITSFNRDTGVITIEASAMDVKVIHQFVECLQEISEFRHVEYSGYTFVKAQGNYSIHVVCVLNEGAGRGEGE